MNSEFGILNSELPPTHPSPCPFPFPCPCPTTASAISDSSQGQSQRQKSETAAQAPKGRQKLAWGVSPRIRRQTTTQPRRGGRIRSAALGTGIGIGIEASPEGATDISLGREPQDLDIDRAEACREENDPEVIMTDPAQPRLIAHCKALDSSTRSEPSPGACCIRPTLAKSRQQRCLAPTEMISPGEIVSVACLAPHSVIRCTSSEPSLSSRPSAPRASGGIPSGKARACRAGISRLGRRLATAKPEGRRRDGLARDDRWFGRGFLGFRFRGATP